ncbi:MAG TPA: toxin-antitoxin system HicB family antitoxin [Streptosporangiaceae bacterium]|nr:toxin-antitoxin system HicB family antitoxin [Streptosporangiaceae bacterium]
MELRSYIDSVQSQFALAAETGGEEARALAERLMGPLAAVIRMTLQDALAQAAEEITMELAPGSVEVRLRGRDPEFVVTAPPPDEADDRDAGSGDAAPWSADMVDGDDGSMSRINLRLPENLKARIETAAGRDGLSVNAWLVRAAAAALDRQGTGQDRARGRRAPTGSQSYTGWVR